MKIVLGLGNPGARYRWTRHNLGYRVADLLAERRNATFEPRGEVAAWLAEVDVGGEATALVKPKTFMNRSGRAALALCSHLHVPPEDLLVVHDDADLELGRVRVRRGGRAGGHNGIRSLIAALGTEEFPRVKLGVRGLGRGSAELAEYVLEEFETDERETADQLVVLGADVVEALLTEGLPVAMNRFNATTVRGEGIE